MNQCARDYLVKKGPPTIIMEKFPKNNKGRHFSKFHCKRKLPNGEIIDRPWIIYSVSNDKIFCFYCKIFQNNILNSISTCGYDDWWNIAKMLSLHEISKHHLQAMLNCCELHERLSSKNN